MLTASTLYRQALPYPHRRVARLEALHAGTRVADWIPIISGEVTCSLTSRVTRSARITVPRAYFPETPTDALSPYVATLRISAGIGYPDGSSELFPLFVGRPYEVSESAAGDVTIQADDLAADVVDARFETPQAGRVGRLITEEIQRLITQAIPAVTFGTDDVDDSTVPSVVWDEDRGQALDDLAAAVQGRWYALGDGSFVTRRYPYTTSTPVLNISDGAGGTMTSATRSLSREGVTNSVTVNSERMDGQAPLRVTRRNLDAGSPTMYGGPYGNVVEIIKLQTPITSSQASLLASRRLSVGQALAQQWTVEAVPDYTLEAGDTVRLYWRGSNAIQVLDSITWPLGTSGSMRLTGRSSIPTPVTSGSDA